MCTNCGYDSDDVKCGFCGYCKRQHLLNCEECDEKGECKLKDN